MVRFFVVTEVSRHVGVNEISHEDHELRRGYRLYRAGSVDGCRSGGVISGRAICCFRGILGSHSGSRGRGGTLGRPEVFREQIHTFEPAAAKRGIGEVRRHARCSNEAVIRAAVQTGIRGSMEADRSGRVGKHCAVDVLEPV